MSWKGLEKPQPGKVIRASWGAGVIEALDELYESKGPFHYGYLAGDLVPDADLLRNIGYPNAKIRELHGGWGYFSYDLYVQGKRVIKDEDPIHIYSLFDEAKQDIAEAIDRSSYVSGSYDMLTAVDTKLAEILGRLDVKISELKSKLEYIYERLNQTLDVDPQRTVESVADLLESVDTDGYKDILTPTPGKKISTRSWFLESTSTAGRIVLRFPQSGKLVGALFPEKGWWAGANNVRVDGYENEPLRLEWSGLSVNSDIFYQITYKEED